MYHLSWVCCLSQGIHFVTHAHVNSVTSDLVNSVTYGLWEFEIERNGTGRCEPENNF